MDDPLVTIKSFSLPWEANLARATLEAQGIPAFVADAHTVTMNWLYSNAIGGVKLQVPERFVEVATKALASQPEPSPADSQEETDAPTCPRCGNRNSTIIHRGRRWTFLTWLLVGVPLFFPLQRCKCLECGEIWKPGKSMTTASSLWLQIVSLWIVVPVAIVFFLLALDIFAGVFLTLFAQVILLGTGLAVVD